MSSPLQEKHYWNKHYEQALSGEGQEVEQNLWWQIADRDLTDVVSSLFLKDSAIDILEAGCGSGSSSFMLAEKLKVNKLTLVDISPNALAFAKIKYKEMNPIGISQVDFIESDISNLSQFKGAFDLVWNVGLVEHYLVNDIERMVNQMYQAVRPGGYLVIGIPNKNSIAVLKAAILGSKFGRKYLRWIRGYKNETEILYSKREIEALLKRNHRQVNMKCHYAGSSLWVGAPNFMVKFFDKMFKASSFSFLLFFVLKKEKV